MKNIKITGARTHNLKNISLEIPKEKITVISGISGSGKSSLAFDTVFAEGQRRYVDNLSSYARQVIGAIEKPDVDSIEAIPPAISIDQKSVAKSVRSTVGTLTESYDFLRLLFARFGKVHCPNCQSEVVGSNFIEVIDNALEFIYETCCEERDVKIYANLISQIRGSHKPIIERYLKSAYSEFIIDEQKLTKDELKTIKLDKNEPHSIEVLIRTIEVGAKINDAQKDILSKSIINAFELSDGVISVEIDNEKRLFSKQPFCKNCKKFFPKIQPRLFSFNSPYGACSACQGLGLKKKVLEDLVIPNQNLTILEGAIRPWARLSGQNNWFVKTLADLAQKHDFSLDVAFSELSKEAVDIILRGDGEFEGVVLSLEKKYLETDSDYLRSEIEQYMVEVVCDRCSGKRLNEMARSVQLCGKNISFYTELEITDLIGEVDKLTKTLPAEAHQVLIELKRRLKNVESVGLGYLTMARSSETLSGGEAQRLRLGVQFDSFLSGVLYVMDEPTISLHPSDTEKLIESFKRLKEEGNTVVIVEHDKSVIESADLVIDIGPGAGKQGGYLVAQGTPQELSKNPASITGPYLSGKKKVFRKSLKHEGNGKVLTIRGARHNNLKNIDISIPLGRFVCVTGLSGSGKSSLVYDIIAKSLSQKLHNAGDEPGEYDSIEGLSNVDKSIKIDQTPIGRTPRSNLATYTGLFTPIRELFADAQESKLRNYSASQFSFNLKGGRCEVCRGDGAIKIEMFFMPDVYVSCEECQGRRYNRETLEILYHGKTIAEVLQMNVDEAADFFSDVSEITDKLSILQKVGLGYLPLGQSATTLSGGEAQRIKLATELSRPSTGQTIYILDEPTTGLHFEDINRLLVVLQELVERGNTVLVIEHNLDVIRCADWVIDLGPGAGTRGGEIVAQGSPEQVAKNPNSLTGQYIAKEF